MRDAADLYGCTVDDMKSTKRNREIVDARIVASYVLYYAVGLSYPQIGKLLNRTHPTVIYFNRKADDWIRKPNLNKRGACAIRELEGRYIR